jgi:hypothetical protein
MSSRVLRSAAAVLALAVLLGGLGLPLLGLALADEPARFCCAKGRCCCADPAAGADERPCLRRGCGCGQRDAVVTGASPWFEAVLPAASRLARPEPRTLDGLAVPASTLARPHVPPVPPPKRLLPA